MDLTIPENQLFSNFVSPQYCEDLVRLGFALKTLHSWKRYYEEYIIFTEAFDPDGYYQTTISETPLVPAFTIKDCENELLDYTLSRSGNFYFIRLNLFKKIPEVSGTRLPDVMAMMLKECIAGGVLDMTRKFKNPYSR